MDMTTRFLMRSADDRRTHRPHTHWHTADRKRREDPEPRLEELLDDPILGLLMDCDGLSRADLERIIDDARRRLASQGTGGRTSLTPAGNSSDAGISPMQRTATFSPPPSS
jgi:hypothetical protein